MLDSITTPTTPLLSLFKTTSLLHTTTQPATCLGASHHNALTVYAGCTTMAQIIRFNSRNQPPNHDAHQSLAH